MARKNSDGGTQVGRDAPLLSRAGAGLGAGVCLAALLAACSQDTPVKGFVLPEGDAEAGAAVFVEMGCANCHSVANTDIAQPEGAEYDIQLGGEIRQVKHYGDLLTSIVSPNHRIEAAYRLLDEVQEARRDAEADGGELTSPMPAYTDRLTVAQLIDLTEFLHSKYRMLPPYTGQYYRYYSP